MHRLTATPKGIFSQGHVPHMVHHFNAPMKADGIKQLIGLGSRLPITQKITDLFAQQASGQILSTTLDTNQRVQPSIVPARSENGASKRETTITTLVNAISRATPHAPVGGHRSVHKPFH